MSVSMCQVRIFTQMRQLFSLTFIRIGMHGQNMD